MRLNGGDRLGERLAKVWLLGNRHPDAGRSIGWEEPFPNISDSDMLVVDLTTLTLPVLAKIGKAKLGQAHELIRDKILSRGTIIVITQPFFQIDPDCPLGDDPCPPFAVPPKAPPYYSNYHAIPTQLDTVAVPDGDTIQTDKGHAFKAYMDNVRSYSFYIKRYYPEIILENPKNTSTKTILEPVEGQTIMDHSNHRLGFTLTAKVIDEYYNKDIPSKESGRLVFLPPPTEPIEEAIGKIISAYRGALAPTETPPGWVKGLAVGPTDEWEARIAKLEEDKSKTQESIDRLNQQKEEARAHCRLLYSKGPELEDAVVRAFEVLGFDDIRRMGGADEEDAAFAMGGSGTPYSHGVIEAKGMDRGTRLQHILQCNRWTDQHAIANGRPSKGVFVPNQHCMVPYPRSSKARMNIEPNQLEQAEMKDICIIPSCVLFEAVRRVLGGKVPDRAAIEGKIAATKGVLTDVF